MATTFMGIGLKESSIASTQHYVRHVHKLAITYSALTLISIVGIGLLAWKSRLFITLAQRTNVETLTILFFLVFYAYIAILCWDGLRGATRILRANLVFGEDRDAKRERKKMAMLQYQAAIKTNVCALNCVIEEEGKPNQPIEIEVDDGFGSLGRLSIDGVKMTRVDTVSDGSNNFFAFVEQQIKGFLTSRGIKEDCDIVQWKKIDDEKTNEYLSLVHFARALEKRLDGAELWPTLRLKPFEVQQLRERIADLCPALRSEAFLPDWEYEGEHKIPIIPEPLGIISLKRKEQRVDPVAAMGSALVILGITLVLIIFFIFNPPWVPGT